MPLHQEGIVESEKRTPRRYHEQVLNVRRVEAQGATAARALLLLPPQAHDRWSIDAMHDQFACGRRFRSSTSSIT